jgi:hypothetical protein
MATHTKVTCDLCSKVITDQGKPRFYTSIEVENKTLMYYPDNYNLKVSVTKSVQIRYFERLAPEDVDLCTECCGELIIKSIAEKP